MLGVLAIVGVLSVGGIAGYSKAMLKYKTNKTIDQITTIITNIKTLFATSRNYTDLDLDIAVRADIIPKDMLSNNLVINPFGGGVDVFASKTSRDENGAFIVAFFDLPAYACITIGSTDMISDGLIAFSYGLNGQKDNDDDDDESQDKCDTSDFDLNEVTETTNPINGSCCDFNSPYNSSCPYPRGITDSASISFGDTCTVAFKFK